MRCVGWRLDYSLKRRLERLTVTSGQIDSGVNLPAGKNRLTVDPASLPPGMRPGAPIPLDLATEATVIEDLHVPVLPAE